MMKRRKNLFGGVFVALAAAMLLSQCGVFKARDEVTARVSAFSAPTGFDSMNIELGTSSPLIAPMKMTVAPDGRIFVCQQDGHIRIVSDDVLQPGNFLTISGVETFGDDGLQDIALDPDFGTTGQPGSGRFYTYHHFMNGGFGNGRVSIYRVSSGNPNVANSTPEATFDFDQLVASDGSRPGSHVGGSLVVGNDGYLYLSMGMQDASATTLGDYTKSAGKIFRMNRATLAPASGNPFETSGANGIAKRIWGKGLRNPFGTAIDRTTGVIFIDDVGSNAIVSPNPDHKAWEETNHLPNPGESGYAGGAPFDFGWPSTEGTGPNLVHRYENGAANENTGGQDCAKIGGDFYRPTTVTFPSSFVGAYIFADYCSTYLKYLPVSQQTPTVGANAVPSNVASDWIDQTGVAITDIDTHPSGAVYILGRTTPERQGSAVGLMYKIFASGPVPTVAVTSPNDGDRFLSGNPGSGTVSVPVTVTADDTNGGLTLVEILQGSTVVGTCSSPPYSPCSTTLVLSRGTYQLKGRATNVLANTKTSDLISITVDGPTAVINTPLASATFAAGQAIGFSGSATDASGVPITNASAYVWNVYLNHGTHKHLEATYTGATSGSFTLSNQAETDPNIAVSFYLTVTDSFGVSHTAGRAIQPIKPSLTLATVPATGLTVKIDSAFYNSNFAFDSVAGIVRDIGVPIKQQHPTTGNRYEFQSWSDGGAYQHTITTPSSNTTYTATFRPATGSGSGLEAEYFPNTSLTGRLCDVVQIVDQDWGTGAPPCAGIPSDGFSVRWSGKLQPYFSEDHTFYVQADGGVRLTVNGNQIINSWTEQSSERVSGVVTLTGGSQYDVKLEYEDISGPANVKLSWATSGVNKEVIPASQLFTSNVSTGGEVLFVVGSASLTVADQAVSDRITTTLGHTVDVVTGPALTSALATAPGRRLVLISDSVASADVGTKVTSAAMPLIDYEPALFDDLGFTTNNYGTSEGTVASQTALNIVAAADPLAAGLASGSNTVATSAQAFNFCTPGGSPTVVARIVGSSTQAAIFRYNSGAAMQTGTAAHRRVGFFPNATAPSALNASGWALFDAAFNWAFGSPPPNQAPSVSAGSDFTATSGTSASLSGSATDDGLPTGSTLTSTWSQTAGPAAATISSPTQVSTPVSFPAGVAGTYTFQLSATDGALSSSDSVNVVVSLPVADTPAISPGTGTYTSAQTVSITDALAGATIRYTLDGTDPTSSSTVYSSTFVVSTNTTIKAKAFLSGYSDSATATAILSFGTKTALLVVGNLTLNTSDAALQSRLQGLGFTVTTALDTASNAGASGKSLVLISETCSSGNLGTKYTSVAVPVIVLEPAVQDEMGMTGASWGTNEGTVSATDVNVVATGPLTGGLSGQTTVVTASSPLNWGVPSSSAFPISRVVGSSTQDTSYKYEQGATMVSGTAAGKRALFWPGSTVAVNMNASGWLLFDSLVSWAAP